MSSRGIVKIMRTDYSEHASAVQSRQAGRPMIALEIRTGQTSHGLPKGLRWAREARNRKPGSQPEHTAFDTQMDAPAQKKSKLIKGATGDWEVVIGMEVHAQVTSQAKLFSGASTAFGGEPNSHVSLVDAAMPGMLPVINEECVRQAVRTGLGLNAKINLKLGVRPQELFLSRSAAGLPDQPVQVADRRRGRSRGRSARRRNGARRHRAAASRAGCRQIAARPACHDVARRSQPFRRRADGDRDQARSALRRRGQGLPHASCARSCATSAPATATWRRAICAPT